MNLGMLFSVIMHCSLLLFLMYGAPDIFFRKKEVQQDYAIVIDVVKVSELTNINVKKSAQSTSSKTEKEAPKSMKLAENTQAVGQIEKEVVEKTPDEAETIKKVKPEEKKVEKKEEKKKEVQKVDNKKSKQKDVNFEKAILKSLEEEKHKKEKQKIDKNFAELAESLKGETNKEFNSNLPMTISEVDAIKSQITRNWNTTAFSGADSKGMNVTVFIELDMDGNVLKVSPKHGNNSSPYYNAFVESALRAIKQSSPLKELNKDKFHSWREIEFNFDSEGMIY